MKIISLKSENVKRLTAVHVEPKDKGLVIVAGDNGAGKSSVLDSITMALHGKESIPAVPVRRGEDKATIDVDLGEITVRRTITPDGGGTLIVRNKDGARLQSPQELLNSLYGKLSFDPLEFVGLSPEKRSEVLRGLLRLDFEAEDKAIDAAYEARTDVNRELKRIQAAAERIVFPENTPDELIDTSAMLDAADKATKQNQQNGIARNRVSDLRVALEKQNSITKELQEKLAASMRVHKTLAEQLGHAEAVLIPEDADISKLHQEIKAAQVTNVDIGQKKTKQDLRSQWKAADTKATALTKEIDAGEKAKRDKILNAKFPIEGLSINPVSKQVEYNGIPFDQASTGEQLRVSVAMGIAMNPKLRVLLVRQGNDLDNKNLQLLADLAKELDVQVWIERVSQEGDVSVVIEDGHVKEPPPKKQKPVHDDAIVGGAQVV